MSVRKFVAVTAVLSLGAGASQLRAQAVSASCLAQATLVQDACQKSADIFAFMAPQIAASLAGGNATPGQAGTLGGIGHVVLGLRATGLRGDLPDLEAAGVSAGPAVASSFDLQKQWLGLPSADLTIGVFGGVPIGLSSIGGLDLIVSGAWLPEVEGDEISLRTPDGQFSFGIGGRLGLIEESAVSPGVSVTYLRRSLPTFGIDAMIDDDSLRVSNAKITTDSWRVVAGKQFLALGLAAGIGQDRYDSHADVSAVVREGSLTIRNDSPATFEQKLTRTNAFANLSLNVAILRFVAEIGQVWGGDVRTYNDFDGASPTDARLYGSVGLRIGF